MTTDEARGRGELVALAEKLEREATELERAALAKRRDAAAHRLIARGNEQGEPERM